MIQLDTQRLVQLCAALQSCKTCMSPCNCRRAYSRHSSRFCSVARYPKFADVKDRTAAACLRKLLHFESSLCPPLRCSWPVHRRVWMHGCHGKINAQVLSAWTRRGIASHGLRVLRQVMGLSTIVATVSYLARVARTCCTRSDLHA